MMRWAGDCEAYVLVSDEPTIPVGLAHKGFSCRIADAIPVHTGDKHCLPVDTVSKGFCHLETLGLLVEVRMRCGWHVG